MEEVQRRCTPTIMVNIGVQLAQESGVFLETAQGNSMLPKLAQLRNKWRQTIEHMESIQLANKEGTTSKMASLELARTLWTLSDAQDRELSPTDFHYLVTGELLDSPDTLA